MVRSCASESLLKNSWGKRNLYELPRSTQWGGRSGLSERKPAQKGPLCASGTASQTNLEHARGECSKSRKEHSRLCGRGGRARKQATHTARMATKIDENENRKLLRDERISARSAVKGGFAYMNPPGGKNAIPRQQRGEMVPSKKNCLSRVSDYFSA